MNYIQSVALCLFVLLTNSTALSAADPWTDGSISIDPVQHRAILTELRDIRKDLYQGRVQLFRLGVNGGSAEVMYHAGAAYFESESRLAWMERDFDRAFQNAECAVRMIAKSVEAHKAAYELSLITLHPLVEEQQRQAEYRLVLLRFDALAKKYGVEIRPRSQAEIDELIEKAVDLLQRGDSRTPVPNRDPLAPPAESGFPPFTTSEPNSPTP